jgi:L-asparaginase II
MSFIYEYRGNIIENRHAVSVAVVNASGKLVAYAGNPGLQAHMRSSAKPFQTQALFLSGAVKHFGFTQKEIALASASHMGTPEHVEVAQGMLTKLGLSFENLACGIHAPADYESRKTLEASGQKPSTIHNNCSGKHSGMLSVALMLKAPLEGYEKLEHPVQQLNLQTIKDLSGIEDIPWGIDGCSVPTFVLPLENAARMFAFLAEPQKAPTTYQEGLEGTFQAIKAFPIMVAGHEELDTVLIQGLSEAVSKGGAEGYEGVALRDTPYGPLGVVFKVEDGNSVVRGTAVVKVLELLGQDTTALEKWRHPIIYNHRKIETGYITADIDLTWV